MPQPPNPFAQLFHAITGLGLDETVDAMGHPAREAELHRKMRAHVEPKHVFPDALGEILEEQRKRIRSIRRNIDGA